MKCSKLNCPTHKLPITEVTIYVVHYKINNASMIGIAYFCKYHLPDESLIMDILDKIDINEANIVKWQ